MEEWKSKETEVALYIGQIRRALSQEDVRSQARLLLDRLGGLGAGGLRRRPRGGTGPRLRRAEWGEREGHKILPSVPVVNLFFP